MQQVANAPAHGLGTEVDQSTTAFLPNRTECRTNGILSGTSIGTKHISQHVTAMHSNQNRIIDLRDFTIVIGQTNAAKRERQMGQRINCTSERNQIKRAFRSVDHGAGELGNRGYQCFSTQPVFDDLFNRTHANAVRVGQLPQVWHTSHGAIFVHDLDDGGGGSKSSQPAQID